MTAGRPFIFKKGKLFRCRFCKEYDRPAVLTFSASKTVAHHPECARAYHREWRARRATAS